MEEKKGIRISLFSLIYLLIIFILIVICVYLLLSNKELSKQKIEGGISTKNELSKAMDENESMISQLNNQLVEKNKTIENLEKEIDELKKNNTEDQKLNLTNIYKIERIKNVHDVFSNDDSEIVKAKKIVEEVVNAVNSKDWYYLAKLIGNDADYFVQYGISNYEVDINDYQKIDNEYVFNESYDFDTTKINSIKDIGLGRLLIIAFEDGGRISIDTNCTGY